MFAVRTKIQKRKKITLTFEQKTEILQKLKDGYSGKWLAIDYNVSESMITYVKSKKSEILESVSNTFNSATKKTLHLCPYSEMENKLYDWFLNQRERGFFVDGNMFKYKAKQIFASAYPLIGPDKFHASDGWLTNFKRRKEIRIFAASGEKLSAEPSSIPSFLRTFRAKIEEMGILESQIYNADETGLFYRLLPNKTFVAAHEKTAPGHKTLKDRITVLLFKCGRHTQN